MKFRLEETQSDGVRHEDIVAKLMKEINQLKSDMKRQEKTHIENLQGQKILADQEKER
jgi:hypothetical protein